MKLSDFKGEKAIEVFADLLEPMAKILSDKEIVALFQSENVKQIEIVKKLLKAHPKEIVWILAVLDDKDPETYEPNFITLPMKLLEIINDESVKYLFTSQSQDVSNVSGSATENTEGKEN